MYIAPMEPAPTTTNDQNPAVAAHTSVSPQLIEAIIEDPTVAQPRFRAMTLLQADELHRMRGLLTPTQRMDLMDRFAKLGNMVPKAENQAAGAAQVTINFIRRASGDTVVIDGESKRLPDADS